MHTKGNCPALHRCADNSLFCNTLEPRRLAELPCFKCRFQDECFSVFRTLPRNMSLSKCKVPNRRNADIRHDGAELHRDP